MSLEQEIKLAVLQDTEIDLAALDWLQSSVTKQKTQALRTDYYDTPEFTLRDQRIALRLRQVEGQWVQTVKTAGQVKAGLHQREEWDQPLLTGEFDQALLRQTPLAPIVDDPGKWRRLGCIFSTQFTRVTWDLQIDDTLVELAYDRGWVKAGGRQTPIHEIELELRHGELTVLSTLAQQLKTALPLRDNPVNKAQLGYDLLMPAKD
ncbi:Adenylate cyclase [Methylophaga frappieri]|uniref:Adenylate cyclase n=1 Tax=Methylophaga frappieri (strain ATCC BAA-2434 / DSM 25690 / JAM7) TaxID=754477 RepID=I1YK80_METFJ|nr:CYTH domain-containing protein [Methylophaga frappieri]AFJ03323.1 Adenylate cyclase [Methylophaga frappieri]